MEGSQDNLACTPPEIRELAKNTVANLLPIKSSGEYKKQYEKFERWCNENKIEAISENVLLGYFELQRRKYKASTLWTIYSMLRSCLNINKNIDISKYNKLQAFLKRASQHYTPRKSKILEEDNINKFIQVADDKTYLAMKVILIMGYNGACRREELTNMSVDDVEYRADSIVVVIPKTKNYVPRTFLITDENWIDLIKKYANLRPKNITNRRFFLTYRNGYCISSPIGINMMGKVPKTIAAFLKLQDPELFTGHCFRRSSATHIANSGGDLLTIKRLGGWKSSSVAESYVEASLQNKIDVAKMFAQQKDVELPQCTISTASEPEININATRSNTVCDITNSEGLTVTSNHNSKVNINIYNHCTFQQPMSN
ncbi:hypothetical protein RI129_007198 [Pyrocoelia pectoralis]|uniref:Tyr recombinase domain-containing protein n=1 Tax=Pyrocoelia pectoralis TaxID=417401 RepID=A0AAN7VDM2_9COLE